jgi:toxin ParE1/3/4
LELIEEFPAMGAPVPYVDASDTRRFPVRRFPYQVVYVELDDALEVIAIAADSQRPGYWQER